MKLCIPVAIFPPEIGGPATYVPELAKQLALRGHEVHVVTFGVPEYEEINGYFIHRLPYPKLPKALAFPLRIVKAGFLCTSVVKKYDIEVIYAQEYLSGLIGTTAKKITGRPMYLKYVGDWAWEYAQGRDHTKKTLHEFYDSEDWNIQIGIFKFLQRIEAKSSDGMIVPSLYLKSITDKWTKTPVHIVPNAIDVSLCEDVEENKNILKPAIITVGRIEKWKNFESLIEAMLLILDEIPEANLYIIGDGPRRERLEALVKVLDLDKVFFLGRLEKSKVLENLKAADVFVLMSFYEGMSHVILEAMSCSTPIIASNVCGNPELVIDKETGILVEPEDKEKIKDAIKRLLEDKKLRDEYAENALEKIKRENSWESHIEKLFSIFEEVTK